MKKSIKIGFCIFLLILLVISVFLMYWYKKPKFNKEIFQNATSVVVYDIYGLKNININKSELDSVNKAEFQLELFKEMMHHSKHINPMILRPTWKGGCLAIVKFEDGTICRLAMSYTPIFIIEGVKGYYKIEGKGCEIWEKEYINRIVQNRFRQQKNVDLF